MDFLFNIEVSHKHGMLSLVLIHDISTKWCVYCLYTCFTELKYRSNPQAVLRSENKVIITRTSRKCLECATNSVLVYI